MCLDSCCGPYFLPAPFGLKFRCNARSIDGDSGATRSFRADAGAGIGNRRILGIRRCHFGCGDVGFSLGHRFLFLCTHVLTGLGNLSFGNHLLRGWFSFGTMVGLFVGRSYGNLCGASFYSLQPVWPTRWNFLENPKQVNEQAKMLKKKPSDRTEDFNVWKIRLFQLLATTAILVAVLLEQLQPWISTLSFDVSLDGSSKPTILVLLPTLIF